MAVWVDDFKFRGWVVRGQRIRSSHLLADTREELNAFAASIGLKPEWLQDGRYPHYDLMASKRVLAVEAGAEVMHDRDSARRLQGLRRKRSDPWCPLRGRHVPETECVNSCPAPEQRVVCAMER